MWWKIYFWVMTVFTVIGIITYGTQTRWTLRDFIDIAYCVVSLIGLYAYVYRKHIFTKQTWKYVFWFMIGITIFDILYLYSDAFTLPSYLLATSYSEEMTAWYIPALFISLPFYLAMYRLAYENGKATTAVKPKKSAKKAKK